jgi:hypothetical protein
MTSQVELVSYCLKTMIGSGPVKVGQRVDPDDTR